MFDDIELGILRNVIMSLNRFGNIDVQTTHALMSITREIKVAIRTECGEHLVACCVDGGSKVLDTSQTTTGQTYAPNVVSALAARHVTCKVEPFAIGTDSRVSVG